MAAKKDTVTVQSPPIEPALSRTTLCDERTSGRLCVEASAARTDNSPTAWMAQHD
jgi:hypothetical protein